MAGRKRRDLGAKLHIQPSQPASQPAPTPSIQLSTLNLRLFWPDMSAYLNEDEKKDVSHLANPGGNPDVDALSLGHDLITPTYSAYADLTFWESVRKFKRLFFIGCISSIAGTYIGYTLTLPGNIVANQGESRIFDTFE